MEILFLGTGTSVGVPVIGCDCTICCSEDRRNNRLRASIVFQIDGKNLLVDTSTDLRAQALENKLNHLDAILFTHPHADHTRGLDEIRIYNFRQKKAIDAYSDHDTAVNIRQSFEYIFTGGDVGSGQPRVNLTEIDGPFTIDGIAVTPVPVQHGRRTILGYRIGDSAYLTDCNGIPESSRPLLEGLDVLILDALRIKPHPTHFCLEESLEAAAQIGAKRTYLTHMSHDFDHQTTNSQLPEGVEMAYDTLRIQCQ